MDTITKNKWLLRTIILLLAVNIATITFFGVTSFNHDRLNKRNKYKNFKAEEGILVKELNLSEEQVIFYQNARKKHFNEIRKLRSDIENQQQLIRNELFSENPDTLKMISYTDSIGILNARFEKANLMHFTHLKKQLSPEQCKIFKNIMDKNSKSHERGEQRNYHRNKEQ